MITEINTNMRLSQHFTLGELCKTKTGNENVPNEEQVNNLKRLCGWLEKLRERYNRYYVLDQTTPAPPNSGGEASGRILPRGSQRGYEEPIIINSGFRSPEVNKAVGGVPTSNHTTGCAVDIRVAGIEQLVRYATILLDISDLNNEDFDELLLEHNAKGTYWLHFAVRPSDNRRRVRLIQT